MNEFIKNLLRAFFILFLFTSVMKGLYAQDAIQIKKGQAADFSGILLTEEDFIKLQNAYELLEDYKKLENNQTYQIMKYAEYIKLKEEEIKIWKLKYQLEQAMRIDLQEELRKEKIKTKVLTFSTSAGISISVAELVGIGIFAILYNTLSN